MPLFLMTVHTLISFLISGSSSDDTSTIVGFSQILSSCHKNLGPQNHLLLEFSFAAFRLLDASSAGFSVVGT